MKDRKPRMPDVPRPPEREKNVSQVNYVLDPKSRGAEGPLLSRKKRGRA